MKKTGYILFALAISLVAACTNIKEDATNSSTEAFVKISEDEGFSESHAEPKETSIDHKGKMVSIPIAGKESASVYELLNENKTNTYLFIFHEWWGLNDHIKNEADKWFEKLGNVNVVAIDLYDGKVATTREKAQQYMSSADEARIESIIDATIESIPNDAHIATIGWCFGGGWSLRAALQAGKKNKACVMYYGMPIKDVAQLKSLNSDVLFIYGTRDKWINEDVAATFKKNMLEANQNLEVLSFDADHAFANPSGDHYREEAAQKANEKAYDFLKKRL